MQSSNTQMLLQKHGYFNINTNITTEIFIVCTLPKLPQKRTIILVKININIIVEAKARGFAMCSVVVVCV